MDVARAVPATLVRMDAASFCADLAAVPATTTVLWHSAMWLYLPEAVQQEVVNAIARAASLARADRPLVHASWERSPASALSRDFSLVTRTWDGSPGSGRPVLLATGMSHGHPAELVTPPVALDADPLLHWVR